MSAYQDQFIDDFKLTICDFQVKFTVLQQSGFLARDYVWNGNLKRVKLYKYRLKDNYLRFYINYKGELSGNISSEHFFSHLIPFEDLL